MNLNNDQLPLIVVVGPTASGKTELAIRLALALDGEVINADSVQIYRYFDIGSGKPSPTELGTVPHHLISALDPLEELDAARFCELAEAAILDVQSRGKRPIVCGGTFLWVRALLYGLAAAPKADNAVRAAHKTIAETEGRAQLHRLLEAVDPICAARLAPNDFVRVSRALEVHQLTGIPMSQWQAEHGFREPKRAFRLCGVARERSEMDERILRRAQLMLEQGFVEEVVGLCERGYGAARAMSSVGYREVKAAVDLRQLTCANVSESDIARRPRTGECAELPGPKASEMAQLFATQSGVALKDLTQSGGATAESVARGATQSDAARNALRDAIAQKTRVFARRQRTWLRDEPVTWIAPSHFADEARLRAYCCDPG